MLFLIPWLCFIQKASEEPEERETLALMAARADSEETQDGETYIEKYTRGVLEVENILSLERLRQVEDDGLAKCRSDSQKVRT